MDAERGRDAGDDEEEVGQDDGPAPPPRRLGPAAQAAAAILWPSFLVASVATMVFFAFVDPALIHESTEPPLDMNRTTGYALGFFFFWIVTAASSALTAYLLRTSPPEAPPGQRGRGGPARP